ncbi:hypothetical protein [Streptococcus suis]|uniref:hypothetical protein n=2 Tax=Streptococcus suis TaxID=1307 RepID=UPI00128FD2E0|nr:hypothetical protein [Streptococcus suis]
MKKKLIETTIFVISFQILIYFFIYQNLVPKNRKTVLLFFVLSLLNIALANFRLLKIEQNKEVRNKK